MAETFLENVKLKIGTETQFQEKLKDLPIGTLVGTTDPIDEGDLSTDIINKLAKADNALPKPTNDTTGSAGQVLKKTASGSEWGDVQSGTSVVANPTLAGTETELTGLQVGDTKYKIPSGGSTIDIAFHSDDSYLSSVEYNGMTYNVARKLYRHIFIGTDGQMYITIIVDDSESSLATPLDSQTYQETKGQLEAGGLQDPLVPMTGNIYDGNYTGALNGINDTVAQAIGESGSVIEFTLSNISSWQHSVFELKMH